MADRSTVKAVRCSPDEWATWGEEAVLAGLSRNAWIRRALNEEVAACEARRVADEDAKTERERLRRLAFPQEGR